MEAGIDGLYCLSADISNNFLDNFCSSQIGGQRSGTAGSGLQQQQQIIAARVFLTCIYYIQKTQISVESRLSP